MTQETNNVVPMEGYVRTGEETPIDKQKEMSEILQKFGIRSDNISALYLEAEAKLPVFEEKLRTLQNDAVSIEFAPGQTIDTNLQGLSDLVHSMKQITQSEQQKEAA